MNASLHDSFGRKIEYLRLSVMDKCNLRCFYCLPRNFKDFTPPADWLSFDEIEHLVAIFGELGVHRVRLTGGEPLLRKHLPALANRLSSLPGIEDLSLSTNATLLSRYTQALKIAGVARLNISLDSLKQERFAHITGGDSLEQVLEGLHAAKHTGFHPIKINMLALKGINDDEFEDMVEFCLKHDFTLRFIETMPMGSVGHLASQHYLNLTKVKHRLAARYPLVPSVMPGGGPARYFRIRGSRLRIGFITPLSQHFCATCNRVRLSVDGTLYLCLGQEHSLALRPLLRRGADNEEIKQAVIDAVRRKPERHEFNEKPVQAVRLMSMTGG